MRILMLNLFHSESSENRCMRYSILCLTPPSSPRLSCEFGNPAVYELAAFSHWLPVNGAFPKGPIIPSSLAYNACSLSPSFPRRRESRGKLADSVLTLVPRLRGDDDAGVDRVVPSSLWKTPFADMTMEWALAPLRHVFGGSDGFRPLDTRLAYRDVDRVSNP